jgi:hypothetical protein
VKQMKKVICLLLIISLGIQGGNIMARTKLLTDAVYSPTIAASEEAIRTQIDDSIQEVLDLALEDVTTNRKLSATGDFTGTINGGDVTLTEPGLSGAFNAHLAENAKIFISVTNPPLAPMVAAVGDGVTDDKAAIQGVIDYVHNQYDAGVVIFPYPSVYYKVSAKLTLYSNITLLGGNGAYIYNDTETAEPVIEVVGTYANRLKNIKLVGLKIQNGTASEDTYTLGKDGIEVKYCDGFTMKGCEVTEIQGANGLSTRYSTDIDVIKNKFYRCTYAQFTVLPECENIHVEKNVFDTCTSLTYGNTYLFATGGDATIDDYFCKNLWIKNNKFLNNPRWEGIDTHGGENIWIEDNYIENVKMGIMAVVATGYVSNPVLKHVTIRGNKVIQGNGLDGEKGIIAGGRYTSATKELIMAEHIVIEDNNVRGFGGTANSEVGTVQTYWAKDVKVENNRISEYAQYGINIHATVFDCKVADNKIVNCRGAFSTAISAGICVNRQGGCYDVKVENNTISADDETKRPAYGITSENVFGSYQIGENGINNVVTGQYRNQAQLPVDKTAIPTANLTQKFGDEIYTDTGIPRWAVSTPKIGFGSLYTNNIVTVDIASGSKVATIIADVNGGYYALPDGMNITIAGAGVAGANLNARVIKNDGATITLDTAASTTVAAANVTYQTLTMTEIPLILSGSATWDPGSLADGAGETSAAITVTGAALGDFVLVSAPYDLQGITCNGYVSAANTVKIRLQNETGGVIDLASGTWKVKVIKS